MNYKSLVGIVLVITLLQSTLFAQNGDYFMTHHSHKSELIDHTNFDLIQDNFGIINIANRAGLVRFDGHSWEHTTTPTSIFSLALDSTTNTIYGAGYNGLGQFVFNDENKLEYQTLADSTSSVGPIYQLLFHKGQLIGLGNNVIYSYHLNTGEISKIESKYNGDIYEIFLSNDQLFVSTENSGLMYLDGDKITEPDIKGTAQLGIEFIIDNPNSDQRLLGTFDNKLFTIANGKISPFQIDDDYLSQSGFIDALWVDKSLVAIATLKGGVIFINVETKKIEQIVNYQSGLPDNEVFAFSKDSNGGIWVAHSNGFTRISPQIPFKNFSNYEGLEGNILSVVNHHDSLYVGTSQGLFYLQKVKQYEETEYLQKQRVEVGVKDAEQEQQKDKRGLFGLFKKKDKQDNASATKKSTKIIYRSKTRKELKSVSYKFHKIAGINSKVTHFTSYREQLYCAGLDGIFRISGENAKTLTREPIQYFTIAQKSRIILASTYNEEIKAFTLTGDNQEIYLFSDYRDLIQHIFEDGKGRIWLTSDDEIFNIQLEGNEISASDIYPIENPYLFNTLGTSVGDKILFVNESGQLDFDESTNSLVTRDNSVSRYLVGTNGVIWVLNNDHWSKLGTPDTEDKNLLNVFDNLNYISIDQNGNHWVVTESNELIKIGGKASSISETYDLYLKHIKTGGQILSNKRKLRFEQSKNALSFEFTQPEFSGILDLKYQYLLEGLSKEWSDWSDEYNIINFNYLPEGSYKLKLRSKDVFGEVREIAPISFKVVPPYWKRPWFYAFEFTALTMLLFISVRLKDLGFKYRLASRLLALITLIIIIEFIQTIAENEFADESSPVFDFIVQVTIAIIVLPVESIIRKYVFKEKNVKILDFVKLKDKGSN